nr:MAG TPA: hypothetical protein [Bacteriophage sp.]
MLIAERRMIKMERQYTVEMTITVDELVFG